MNWIVEVIVPVSVAVVLPVLIVWIVFRASSNRDNKNAEIIIKAIENNSAIDADRIADALGKPRHTPRQILQSRLQRAVRRFLTALCCGDSTLADDLAQDTFVRAYLRCGDFREESKFSSWIYRISYNTFVSNRRSVRRTEELELAVNVKTEDSADRGFEYQGLYECLKRLSEKERYAILLHYMQGYSVKEISEITGSTADAVKQHLSRGRHHLRLLLGE